jgi:hypothetical protein
MRACTAFFLGFVAAVGPAAAQVPDTLSELLKYGTCSVSSEMKAVYERPADARDRSVILRVTSAPNRYVRCDFIDDGAQLSCRLAPPGNASVGRVAALARLGFVVGVPLHDLTYSRALGGTPDFDAISRLMLTALHDAHDVREETPITVVAPYAGTIIFVCKY